MRTIDDATVNALNGSRQTDTITVYNWYGGTPVSEDPLPISSWSLDYDVGRQIQTFSCTVADKDGKYVPWLLEDPLGVGGAELQVIYNVGGAGSVNMGWYRITAPDPEDRWRHYIIDEAGTVNVDSPIPNGKRSAFASSGSTIQIAAADRAINIKNNKLLSPSSPKIGTPTAISEITRLTEDIVSVVTASGVVDEAVSKRMIYERERLDAVEDLCSLIACAYRMNGDGMLEIYPLEQAVSQWHIRGGPEGVLVRVRHGQQLDGLYNVFVAEGTTAAGHPVRGIARITEGPLRVDGPHGTYVTPPFESPALDSQARVNLHAARMRDTFLRGLTVDLQITCLPHPGLQQGDLVTVAAPVVNGRVVELKGRIKRMLLASSGTTVSPMELTVECPYNEVQAVIGGINREQ